ncbi:hypothetical protein [Thaumasiovibrio subtropicus]|uniref:hypothetical protein n=1 Tax=Thaumasiovibrio subtropicus TaxID=1891207 RepID=UPI00131AF9F4|nr:hypothetical protein [Thaumasiovibrio subtropicus]
MKNMIWALSSALILLSGCNSGGSDSSPTSSPDLSGYDLTRPHSYTGYYVGCGDYKATGTITFTPSGAQVIGSNWHHDCRLSPINQILTHEIPNLSAVSQAEFSQFLRSGDYSSNNFTFSFEAFDSAGIRVKIDDAADGSIEYFIMTPSAPANAASVNLIGDWQFSGYKDSCLGQPISGTLSFTTSMVTMNTTEYADNSPCDIEGPFLYTTQHGLPKVQGVTLAEFRVLLDQMSTNAVSTQVIAFNQNEITYSVSYADDKQTISLKRQ